MVMFRHVVLLRWTPEATVEQGAAVKTGLEALPATISEIRSYTVGADARVNEGNYDLVVVADVSTPEGAAGFVRDARAALGGVDILVANAGGPPPGNFEHVTVDQYLDAFELNCRSTIAMWRRSPGENWD